MSARGTVMLGMNVAQKSRRNTKITITTSAIVRTRVNSTSRTEARIGRGAITEDGDMQSCRSDGLKLRQHGFDLVDSRDDIRIGKFRNRQQNRRFADNPGRKLDCSRRHLAASATSCSASIGPLFRYAIIALFHAARQREADRYRRSCRCGHRPECFLWGVRTDRGDGRTDIRRVTSQVPLVCRDRPAREPRAFAGRRY